MTVEILFGEVANLFGDMQNMEYLRETCPSAEFIGTRLTDEPWFVSHRPDLIYMGAMTENTQRRAIEALRPYADRLKTLLDEGVVMLFTGNAGEVFFRQIDYKTEKKTVAGLGFFDVDVVTDWFDRYNGKTLGTLKTESGEIAVTGFRSQFSRWYGDNEDRAFLTMDRGIGMNETSKKEGLRVQNAFFTAVIGPLLPLNPLFTEYLLRLAGENAPAAHREAAMQAYEQRLKEMRDPATKF